MVKAQNVLLQRRFLFQFVSVNRTFLWAFLVHSLIVSESTTTRNSHSSWMQRAFFSTTVAAVAMSTSTTTTTTTASNRAGAIIFLHGLGDSPSGWSDLRRSLPSMIPRLSQLEYVFPAAPTIPISINGGMEMPGWFDLYDWPIEVGSKDDPEGLQAAVSTVEHHVRELNAKGIPSNKIIIGGFSQGGAIALLTVYRSQTTTTYAGCVGLSAWLTLPDQLKVSDQAKQTPLYWGHGTFDDKVVFAQQAFGVGKLREQDVNVQDESFKMGHSSHPKEIESVAKFVDRCIFANEPEAAAATSEL